MSLLSGILSAMFCELHYRMKTYRYILKLKIYEHSSQHRNRASLSTLKILPTKNAPLTVSALKTLRDCKGSWTKAINSSIKTVPSIFQENKIFANFLSSRLDIHELKPCSVHYFYLVCKISLYS